MARGPALVLAVAVAVTSVAGCSSNRPRTSAPATTASHSDAAAPTSATGGSGTPAAAGPPGAASAKVEAAQACASFQLFLTQASATPLQVNLAMQSGQTLTLSVLAAHDHDPARWQQLSEDVEQLLTAMTAGGTFHPPAAGDPKVRAVARDCA